MNKNFNFLNNTLRGATKKDNMLISNALFSNRLGKYYIRSHIQKNILSREGVPKYLHLSSNAKYTKQIGSFGMLGNARCNFSFQSQKQVSEQEKLDYNDFSVIKQLHHSSNVPNKFTSTKSARNLSSIYSVITVDLQRKYKVLETVLHSQERDLYKIVEQIIIVLQSFAQANRRQILQENVVKVIRQFNNKLISAYLQNIEQLEEEQIQARKKRNQPSENLNSAEEETDSTYELHENYTISQIQLQSNASGGLADNYTPRSGSLDASFIFFYIQTLKDWLLARIQTDKIIKQAEQEMYQFLTAREVSDIQDTLKALITSLHKHYVYQEQPEKRQNFPFDRKIRSICLLPYLENKKEIQKYLDRLTQQNQIIYLKESQIVNLMYDVVQLKPELNNTQFVYQIQSTKVYQNLFSLNSSYIKARFIMYVRNFMVCYQQVQFYQLFRQIQMKMKYPTVRTFIRLAQILKTQADDLHCEYNKVMNKYSYNILISIITSQSYNVENTKLEEFLELFESLNNLEKSGQTLYQELGRYLKQYVGQQNHNFTDNELERLYRLFTHVLEQSKPVFKYQEKDGLNKQYGRKTIILINSLLDILFEKYPQISILGSSFVKSYVHLDQTAELVDDRLQNTESGVSQNLGPKLQKLKNAFSKVIEQSGTFSLINKNTSQISTLSFLDAVLVYLRNSIHVTKKQLQDQKTPNKTQDSTLPKAGTSLKIMYRIFSVQSYSLEQGLFKSIFQPLLKEYHNILNEKQKLSNKQCKQIYLSLYRIFECINEMENKQYILEALCKYSEIVQKAILKTMKFRLAEKQNLVQRQKNQGIKTLEISLPRGDSEMLLCLGQLIKFRRETGGKVKNDSHNNTQSPLDTISDNLSLIFNFINKIAVSGFKGVEKSDLINMLNLMKSLEELRSSQKETVLLIELSTAVYQYLYVSLSTFMVFSADRGKSYLKLNITNSQSFLQIVNHFISKKSQFKGLPSKKKLVVLQAILVVLVRKKYLKLNPTHLKRSQNARILLAFMQIFQYPENLTLDFKKIVQQAEFTPGDLQEQSNQILQKFTDMNWTISKYLQDNKITLTSSKRLSKLTSEELKRQFQSTRPSKIYEMILRNRNYQLPFQLPEPKSDDLNMKLIYIIEKVYQKIHHNNNYSIPKISRNNFKWSSTKKNKKRDLSEQEYTQMQEKTIQQTRQQEEEENYDENKDLNYASKYTKKFIPINLEEEKQYIKRQSLVNYIYEEHYKMSENKLPIHYKKQTWKNLGFVTKETQIQSLQIDEKIDQNIYKRVLLSLLGYVQKVKMVANEFHSHSFIQYVAAQLDMQVFFLGCVARISRKNKPQQNVLFVCAVQKNYKLLYICTHILRESGENAYIISEKTKQAEFKQFLERILPQPFQSQQSEIVDKIHAYEQNQIVRQEI